MMRSLRNFIFRWKFLIVICFVVYGCILYFPLVYQSETVVTQNNAQLKKQWTETKQIQDDPPRRERAKANLPAFKFSPVGEDPFYVEDVLTNYGISLEQKFTCAADKNAPPKILLSINAGHGQENLGGCPDWNCQLTYDRSKVKEADAVMLMAQDGTFTRQRPDQYVIFFSQESPKNSGFGTASRGFFNMSLGFRHDSPAASPYGYTVKLAPQSRKSAPFIDRKLVEGKNKGAAWFVSHCETNSHREKLVAQLQKDFEVDIFGGCGTQRCPKGGECENALDTSYHFYIAFENSICQDYLTEKLWNQGFKRDIIPIVLKRKLTSPFVPPNSFIAVDDFSTTQEMANYLNYLMRNKTAYMEYFNWRHDHKVIFLNGRNHDVLEKPWGFCQVCRLMWEQPKKHYSIDDFNSYWYDTCEIDGALVDPILEESRKVGASETPGKDKSMKSRIASFNDRQRGFS